MKQGVLPFQYEEEKTSTGMTALAGLPGYLELARVVGLARSIERHVNLQEGAQGWSDSQMVTSLVLLNPSLRSRAGSGWWRGGGRLADTGEGRGILQGVAEIRDLRDAAQGAQGGREEMA